MFRAEFERMGRPKTPFPLKLRPGSSVWQVAYYTPEGKRKYKSTGEKDHDLAVLTVARWRSGEGIEKGTVSSTGLTEYEIKAQVLFEDVTQDFFSGEACPYLQLRHKSNAPRASASVALDKNLLDTWIAPFFAGMRFCQINGTTIDGFVEHLRSSGISSAHIHNILSTTKKMFSTLYSAKRVVVDLSGIVPTYSRTRLKKKEMLSVAEVQELLYLDYPYLLTDPTLFKKWLMTALCFACGLRTGEFQASQWDRFIVRISENPDGSETRKGYLKVDTVWERETKELRDGTKTYGERYVPLPSLLFDPLYDYLQDADMDALIFESNRIPGQPFYGSVADDYMTAVCKALKIVKHLSPHRGRDWFQSVLTGKVSRDLVDYAIGHSQGNVRDTYQGAIFDQLEPIRVAMEEILTVAVKTREIKASEIRKSFDVYKRPPPAIE